MRGCLHDLGVKKSRVGNEVAFLLLSQLMTLTHVTALFYGLLVSPFFWGVTWGCLFSVHSGQVGNFISERRASRPPPKKEPKEALGLKSSFMYFCQLPLLYPRCGEELVLSILFKEENDDVYRLLNNPGLSQLKRKCYHFWWACAQCPLPNKNQSSM